MCPALSPAVHLPPSVGEAGVRGAIALGEPTLDAFLGGGLARAGLHEVFAASDADAPAATGFAAALSTIAAQGKPIVWVRHDALDAETGRPYPPGLAALGFDPEGLILVRARTMEDILRAAGEASRCAGLGGVLIEVWASHKSLDLTASRRLALRTEESRIPVMMVRTHARPEPSAAATRWRVRARPSRALPANAPGAPAFEVALVRRRNGAVGGPWSLEWNRDERRFCALDPLPVAHAENRRARRGEAASPGAVVSVSAHRSRTAQTHRRAG